MAYLEIDRITKKYGAYYALNNISFQVNEGTIFGLLGPNGAGKTTLIRIITNILYPDSGEVRMGGVKSENFNLKHLIGYMPEERGLYKKMKVGEQLKYLAQLRGLKLRDAEAKIKYWLDKLEAGAWYNKKIDELSKGMSQKIQFIATVMHEPKLIILDEPFSGLDPINAKLIENEMKALKDNGAIIIFSTHRLEQVELFCNSLVLVNKGEKLIEGEVNEVQQRFKKNTFHVGLQKSLVGDFQSFEYENLSNLNVSVKIKDGFQSDDILKELLKNDYSISTFHEILPSIHDIFIEQVSKNNHSQIFNTQIS